MAQYLNNQSTKARFTRLCIVGFVEGAGLEVGWHGKAKESAVSRLPKSADGPIRLSVSNIFESTTNAIDYIAMSATSQLHVSDRH